MNERRAVAVFAATIVAGPILFGECFPFTTAPMFRDAPRAFARYHVTDGAGATLALETFGLHMTYDGNPPGLGVGRAPAPTLHAFGEWREPDEVGAHVRRVLDADPSLPRRVTIRQEIVRGGEAGLERQIREWSVSAP